MIWIILIVISIGLIVYSVVKLNDLVFILGYILLAITLFLGITINTEDEKINDTYVTIAIAEDSEYLRTRDGMLWRVVNKNFEKGKEYKVTFDSKGTNNIFDDEILEIN